MEALQQIEAAVREAAERVGPAVVGVGPRAGAGSTGVVIATDRVVTNAHNVGPGQVVVTFADGSSRAGAVAAADVDGDLAVVTVDTSGVRPAQCSDGDLRVGSAVIALANPGGRGLRATLGLVSAIDQSFRGPRARRIAGAVEHTAPLAHGSSGGPLVDAAGQIVGLNTHRLRGGFYLAQPADAALRARVDGLGRGEAPTRARLGLALAPAEVSRRLRAAVGLPDREGLLVRGVEDDSPAQRAGLRRGDLIVEADGQPVATSDALLAALDRIDGSGDALALTIVRGTEEIALQVAFSGTREEGSA